MDVSENKIELGGQKLLDTIASLTGLPSALAHGELNEILEKTGQSSGEVTLESLRAAMLEYLQSLDADMNGVTHGEGIADAGSDNSEQKETPHRT